MGRPMSSSGLLWADDEHKLKNCKFAEISSAFKHPEITLKNARINIKRRRPLLAGLGKVFKDLRLNIQAKRTIV